MYLEIERKLYTLAIAALATSSMVAVVTWAPLSTEAFVALSRSVGSARAVAIAEVVLRQIVVALICVVPLKLTRHRLSALDALLVGVSVSIPTLLMPCDLAGWELVTIAMAPLLFALVFWILRGAPPSSWLDGFYSDQKPWLSVVFAAMFASQISTVFFFVSGSRTLLRPSILIALVSAVLALLARRFDRAPLWIAAAGALAFNLSLYVRGWQEILTIFGPISCSDLSTPR
jgi:hypothetical protein